MAMGGSHLTLPDRVGLLSNVDNRSEAIIKERAQASRYPNKIGPIINRLRSQLLSHRVEVSGSTDPFWNEFRKTGFLLTDDDDSRASLESYLAEAMFILCSTGKVVTQVDVPVVDAPNRLEQERRGGLNPYVILHHPSVLRDWAADSNGLFFAKLHQMMETPRTAWNEAPTRHHSFTIYQKDEDRVLLSQYKIYSKDEPDISFYSLQTLSPEKVIVTEVRRDQEIFNANGQFRFPVITQVTPSVLNIGDALYENQRILYNLVVGLDTALLQANFAMPVIVGGNDDPIEAQKQKWGDGHYLWLPTDHSIEWMERGTSSAANTREQIKAIETEMAGFIFELSELVAASPAAMARSFVSKREDKQPGQVLLDIYGNLMSEMLKQVMDCASIAHGETVEWSVTNLSDYMDEPLTSLVSLIQSLPEVGSSRFLYLVLQFLVRQVLEKMRIAASELPAIEKEIQEYAEKKAGEAIQRAEAERLISKMQVAQTGVQLAQALRSEQGNQEIAARMLAEREEGGDEEDTET